MFQIKNLLDKKDLIFYLVLFSIFLKFILLFVLSAKTFSDGRGYIHIAEAIYNNNFIFPIKYTDDMPITPYIYSLLVHFKQFIGISTYAIPNIILASLTIFTIFKIVLVLYNNYKIANTAAIIMTMYPFFNFYSITILTETIYIFFLYISMYYAVKFMKELKLKDILLFSLFFALTSLTRASTVPMYLFF